jgi:hypothetical protein
MPILSAIVLLSPAAINVAGSITVPLLPLPLQATTPAVKIIKNNTKIFFM